MSRILAVIVLAASALFGACLAPVPTESAPAEEILSVAPPPSSPPPRSPCTGKNPGTACILSGKVEGLCDNRGECCYGGCIVDNACSHNCGPLPCGPDSELGDACSGDGKGGHCTSQRVCCVDGCIGYTASANGTGTVADYTCVTTKRVAGGLACGQCYEQSMCPTYQGTDYECNEHQAMCYHGNCFGTQLPNGTPCGTSAQMCISGQCI